MTQPLWKRTVALLSITVWLVWAYLRLLPPASTYTHGQLSASAYDVWSFGNLAYSDVVKLYQTRFLFMHLMPYIHNLIEYPVVTGVFMSLMGWLGHGLPSYFLLTFIVFWAIAVLVYFLLERLVPSTAIYFAVLPLLLVYGLLNWDLLGIGLMVVGWFLYQRQRYTASAVIFALGVFAKLFPIFFLPFIAAELWRKGQRRTLGLMVLAFVATSAVINIPFAVGNFRNWSYFFTFNAVRPLGGDLYNNPWIHGISVPTANLVSFLVVAVAVFFFMWRVFRGQRVVDATAYTVVIFFFVNKVYSPQYTLWVFVLLILAEWPIWTYLILSIAGLVDYVNSFSTLYLLTVKSPAAGWYVGHLFGLGLLFRYVALATSGIAAAISGPKRAAEQAKSSAVLSRVL